MARRFCQPDKERNSEVKKGNISNSDSSNKRDSKRQKKKNFQELKDRNLCGRFVSGKCDLGDKCKNNRDIESYLNDKPNDLPGSCPFSKAKQKCPYGLNCRWASTHTDSDALAQQYRNLLNNCKCNSQPERYFDLRCSEEILEMENCLDKELQYLLWKEKYEYKRADRVLKKHGIRNERSEKKKYSKQDISNETEDDKQNHESHYEESNLKREFKKIDFSNKLYLAPLTTVGNLPFRRICLNYGADVTCGEMALVTKLLQGQASEWALLKRHPSEKFFGVQIAGGFRDTIACFCELIDTHCKVDFVDLNVGCPIDVICDRSAGSTLLTRLNKLEEIVKTASSVLSRPLTVKLRKGYYTDKDIAHKILPRLSDWGAFAATVHGRSREQRYTKQADWKYINQCANICEGLPLQVIGNGDIFSYEEWSERLGSCSHLSTCMIGRGALIKPWIFTEIKEQRIWDISSGERLEMLKQFSSWGLEHWGSDERGVENTRRFLLEWLSLLCRYIPVGLLEVVPQHLHWWAPGYFGRDDLETLFASDKATDWIRISEMLLGRAPDNFKFAPKHAAKATS